MATSFELKIKVLTDGDDVVSVVADILTHGLPDGIVKDLGTGYKYDICNPTVVHSCLNNDFSSDLSEECCSWHLWERSSRNRTNFADG